MSYNCFFDSILIGKPSKKKTQLSLAREKRKNFGHISPQKPTQTTLAPKDSSLPPQCEKRLSIPVEHCCLTPPQPKKRRFRKRSHRERETLCSYKFDQKIVKLERKWFAVAKYCWHWRHFDQTISPSIVQQIGREVKVCEATLRTWVKSALIGNSLLNIYSSFLIFN